MTKVYIASSWKNEASVKWMAAFLRSQGFEVDDFTDDSTGRFVFHYSELGNLEELDAIRFLQYEKAQRAFEEDKRMIDWADAVVLLLPAGRSAHLEAGYAKGRGKQLIIYQSEFPVGEFDVMYGFADLITSNVYAIVDHLAKIRPTLGTRQKQVILDVLNSLEVIERQGGEDAYILAANNEENRAKLAAVGIPPEKLTYYGDEETFCILALAFGEGYADEARNGKLIAWDERIDDELRYRVLNGEGTAIDAERLLRVLEPELFAAERG